MKKDNIFVFIIDRGWLTNPKISENGKDIETFFFTVLQHYIHVASDEHGFFTHIEKVSIMNAVTPKAEIQEIDSEELTIFRKVCFEKFNEIFCGVSSVYSSRAINASVAERLNNLYLFNLFLVYTESNEEIMELNKNFNVIGSLEFLVPNVHKMPDNIRQFKITTTNQAISTAKQMIPWLMNKVGYQDIVNITEE